MILAEAGLRCQTPLTARLLTGQEQAHEHIQIGNLTIQYPVIKEWIDVIQEQESGDDG